MSKPTPQDCHALTTYFVKRYNEVLGSALRVNRNKARWGFESVLIDYSPSQARELIDFYVEHWTNPTIEWFLFNYEQVDERMDEAAQEKVHSDKLLKETQKRLEEWRRRWQQTN